MGNPAARATDFVSHPSGHILSPGPGSANVFIEGLPAWRANTDVHICWHHHYGLVIAGSQTVFINGYPACRQGDIVVESGEVNPIIGGSSSVSIG